MGHETALAAFAVALVPLNGGARFAACDARFACGLTRIGNGLRERLAVAQFDKRVRRLLLSFECGVARCGEPADFCFQRGEPRRTFGGRTRGTRRVVLRLDQPSFGPAIFLFGRQLGFAGGIGIPFCFCIFGESLRTTFFGLCDLRFKFGQTIALCQACSRGRGGVCGSGIPVPAP